MILIGMTKIMILMITKCIHHMMSHISVIALQIYCNCWTGRSYIPNRVYCRLAIYHDTAVQYILNIYRYVLYDFVKLQKS